MRKTRILGTGSGIPPKVLTNLDLEKLVETSDAWITERTGIKERRVLDPSRATSDLATDAAREALARAGVSPAQIDCVIVGTISPDMPMPAAAVLVQKKLGVPVGAAFDLSAACAGFIYGLGVADAFIKTGQFRRVLLVGVEVLTRIVDWKDRNTCVLFGDGAGAVVLGPEEQPDKARPRGILSTHMFADGNSWEHLYLPGGGSLNPTTQETVAQNLHTVKMNGRAVFAQAVKNIAASCVTALEANHMTAGDVDLVVAHQANLRILEGVAQRCGLPMSKFYLNIHKYGNTSSASIPIALDEAVRDGTVKEGMTLLLCALGAGFSWGSAVVRW
jgi:3-oxoacyl-[acyl-carrier-protein] synthase III